MHIVYLCEVTSQSIDPIRRQHYQTPVVCFTDMTLTNLGGIDRSATIKHVIKATMANAMKEAIDDVTREHGVDPYLSTFWTAKIVGFDILD